MKCARAQHAAVGLFDGSAHLTFSRLALWRARPGAGPLLRRLLLGRRRDQRAGELKPIPITTLLWDSALRSAWRLARRATAPGKSSRGGDGGAQYHSGRRARLSDDAAVASQNAQGGSWAVSVGGSAARSGPRAPSRTAQTTTGLLLCELAHRARCVSTPARNGVRTHRARRAKEKRAWWLATPPAGIPTRKPRPARAGRSSPLIHASPAKSGEQLRCGGRCAPGVAAVELRAWPHRRL